MLEKVTFNKKPMKKAVYKEQWDELLAKLVVLQQQAHNEGVGLVVLFEGWNGAGKGSRISDLMYTWTPVPPGFTWGSTSIRTPSASSSAASAA